MVSDEYPLTNGNSVSERIRARRSAIQARRDTLARARDLHLQDLQMGHLDEGELSQERFVSSTCLPRPSY